LSCRVTRRVEVGGHRNRSRVAARERSPISKYRVHSSRRGAEALPGPLPAGLRTAPISATWSRPGNKNHLAGACRRPSGRPGARP
jgi:hypothetical protein